MIHLILNEDWGNISRFSIYFLPPLSFLTETPDAESVELVKYLSILPQSGELPSAYDRNNQHQVVQVIQNYQTLTYKQEPECLVFNAFFSLKIRLHL